MPQLLHLQADSRVCFTSCTQDWSAQDLPHSQIDHLIITEVKSLKIKDSQCFNWRSTKLLNWKLVVWNPFLKFAGSPINLSAKEAVDRKKKQKLWRPLVEPRVRHIQTGANQIFTASWSRWLLLWCFLLVPGVNKSRRFCRAGYWNWCQRVKTSFSTERSPQCCSSFSSFNVKKKQTGSDETAATHLQCHPAARLCAWFSPSPPLALACVTSENEKTEGILKSSENTATSSRSEQAAQSHRESFSGSSGDQRGTQTSK